MSKTAENESAVAADRVEGAALDESAGIAGMASAESAEILNLLNDQGEAGGCCGGSCCS